ncbi:hypothetical protein ACFO1B_17470 [Dactylosporangium siamense]|uniref:Uncharacterized protein n=1 Tax=Dactylosporangium siamense TaxID=685454 RepID=A0A919PL92_9ACTN|nr:hypothetical protein [Dactylosporangium siamense]GIG45632.1 hypothetical protein Dsi01nite_036730 [Dactylosporangium siamense]
MNGPGETLAETVAASLERLAEQLGTGQDAGDSYGVLLSLYRADVPDLPEDTKD